MGTMLQDYTLHSMYNVITHYMTLYIVQYISRRQELQFSMVSCLCRP